MEDKIRELYAEFAKASDVKKKWHGVFTAHYVMAMFKAKFGEEMFTHIHSENKSTHYGRTENKRSRSTHGR